MRLRLGGVFWTSGSCRRDAGAPWGGSGEEADRGGRGGGRVEVADVGEDGGHVGRGDAEPLEELAEVLVDGELGVEAAAAADVIWAVDGERGEGAVDVGGVQGRLPDLIGEWSIGELTFTFW